MAAPENTTPTQSTLNTEPERDLVTWIAPARPFKRRDKQFYVTTFAMAGIVGLILFLAEGLMPVLLIVSLVFLYYVLSTVEPEKVQYKVTNKGIKIADKRTDWELLRRFWFSGRFGTDLLVVESVVIPGRLELVIDPSLKEKIKKEVSGFIPYEEVPGSRLDRITSWVAQRLPGNK